MKLYRFSPIKSHDELIEAIKHIHVESYKLCKASFGKHLPNSGNIGVFMHYDEEFEAMTKLRKQLTQESNNYNQKYFILHEPIVIEPIGDIPEITYTHLYIRRPDPYRHHVGDIDFYLPQQDYDKLKAEIEAGREFPAARLFDRPDLDMIELHNPDSDVLAYVSTKKMSDLVKVKQSEHTKL